MINAVYFINGTSGVTLLSRQYRKISIDEQLIGGFLQALSQFVKELIKNGETDIESRLKKTDIRGIVETEVKEIHLKGYDLIYEMRHPLVVVALIDERDDEFQVRSALKVLLEKFIDRFRDIIDSPIVDEYKEFIPVIDEVLKNGKIGLIYPVKKGDVPKLAVNFGLVTEEEYRILQLCNGKLTVDEIAKELNITTRELWKFLENLKKKDLVEFKSHEEIENKK
ncbi:MAG: helix-turn-helix transcriptional regulator [Candidatus Asgardarchaeia archaeon]